MTAEKDLNRRHETLAIIPTEEAIESARQESGIPYPLVYDLRDKLREVRCENGEHPVFRCVRSACSQLRDADSGRKLQKKDPLFTLEEHVLLIWYYSQDGDEMMDECLMRDLKINEEELQELLRRYRQEVANMLGVKSYYADVFMGLLKMTA